MASSPPVNDGAAMGEGPMTLQVADETYRGALSGARTALAVGGHKDIGTSVNIRTKDSLPTRLNTHSVRHTTLAGLTDHDVKAMGHGSNHVAAHAEMADHNHGITPDSPVTVMHFSKPA